MPAFLRAPDRLPVRSAWRALALCLALPCAVIASAAPAVAAEPAEEDERTRNARLLGRTGIELYDKGQYEDARRAFQTAYALFPAPTLAVREARSLVKLGRLVEATEAYARAAKTPPGKADSKIFEKAVAEASAELAALRPRIPTLAILVSTPAGQSGAVKVLLDGVPVDPLDLGRDTRVDPGEHVVECSIAGGPAEREKVKVVEGEAREVHMKPRRSKAAVRSRWVAERPATPSGVWKTVGIATLGAGAAALVTGVVTGALAMSTASDLESTCPNGACPASSSGDVSSYAALRTTSTLGYVAAAGLGAAGVAILVVAPAEARAAPRPAPMRRTGALVAMRGSFQ